jgi:NADH-quinone oxidoreductase subunit M
MLAHGITATGLFFVVGVVYERAHHREVDRLGGLKEPMPLFSGLSAVLFFASLGLPGLCGFVGEFLVMTSVWSLSPVLSVLSIFATILTAGYLLWTWQRVFLGTNPTTANFPEIYLHELLVLLPLVLLSIVLGILPVLIFNWVEPSLQGWIDVLEKCR